MPRSSREIKNLHGELIESAAAALFKQRGVAQVSVAEVMRKVGLTHGGFYKHFASKDMLAAEACRGSFAETAITRASWRAQAPDPQVALRTSIDRYLTTAHRDRVAEGCPSVAFASDVARAPANAPLRAAYANGIREVVDEFAALIAQASAATQPGDSENGADSADSQKQAAEAASVRCQALGLLATLTGALMLARATRGDPLSEEMLAAARGWLLGTAEAAA